MRMCRRLCTLLVLLATMISLAPALPATQAAAHPASSRSIWAENLLSDTAISPGLSPSVRHTGSPPTGYAVTFHYRDPRATSVQIKGEWYFSSPAQTTLSSSQGLLPAKWAPGDFPIAHPNDVAANWPVIAMTKDPGTGVWSYTTPLPSGVFTYGFFINCRTADQTGCTEISDPSNPPWNTSHGITAGSVEPNSQVYVPSDHSYRTADYSWQAPSRVHGSLAYFTYTSPESLTPRGTHALAIYTPPAYNPQRATPYPTLYLSHGYWGNEMDWTTQGDAANILDNLIGASLVQPMVVVMTNFNGFAGDCLSHPDPWVSAYDHDLVANVIPYVQAHFNVSSQVSQRAFGGLSCGGGLVNSLLVNHTSAFGYYAVMSPFPGITTLTPAQVAALRRVGILVGGGRQDPIHRAAADEVATLQGSRIGVVADFINGGHAWYVWRILLRDFLARVAFMPVRARPR